MNPQKTSNKFIKVILLGPVIFASVFTLGFGSGLDLPPSVPTEILSSKSAYESLFTSKSKATPTPTPERYRIKIDNLFPWDMYIFLNGKYLTQVEALSSKYVSNVKKGTYTLLPCIDRKRDSCESPLRVIIGKRTVITLGKLGKAAEGISTSSTNGGYQLKINNRSNFWVQVYMDGNYFFHIPALKYVTYRPITPGTHVFRFCIDRKYCWSDRWVEVSGDTELFLGP